MKNPSSAGFRACTYGGLPKKKTFQAEIMPGNALTRACLSPRPPPLNLAITCLRGMCFIFVLITSIIPRSFYSAEYEILTPF